MQKHSGAQYAPLFPPAGSRVYRGMLVEVLLQLCAMSNAPSLEAIRDTLALAYEGSKQIRVADKASCEALGRMEIEQVGATDRLDIFVFGNERTGQARLIAALDNLGKGAAGAAIGRAHV